MASITKNSAEEASERKGSNGSDDDKDVQKTDFGLSSEQIMQIPERDLRQFVSLKKIAPYRNEEHFVHGDQRRRFLPGLCDGSLVVRAQRPQITPCLRVHA